MVRGAAVAVLVASLALAPSGALAQPAPARGAYLFDLTTPIGPIESSWATLNYDRSNKELYVVSDGSVGIFNDVGMEIYRFGDDSDLGAVLDVIVLDDGDLVVLSALPSGAALFHCNFRGEVIGKIELRGVPAEIAQDFFPTALAYRGGKLYLADTTRMRVVVAGPSGAASASYDLVKVLKMDGKQRGNAGMQGFDVDASGNLLFTIAPLFKAFVVSPDGKVRSFGQRGSTPGRFNITGGITSDDQGHYLVTDIRRSVVMVFDESTFEFLGQFAERGWHKGGLVAPLGIVAAHGKVFVSQSANRGVSVFTLSIDAPKPTENGPPQSGPESVAGKQQS